MAIPYAVYQFGTLPLPGLREAGQEDNLGTGKALTSFQQLPNGTFFDNYGDNTSPQGLRPVTKEGILYGETAAAIESAIDDLRAYIGVREKLTVRFRSGQLRWQWARLTEVNTPALSGRSHSIPVQMVFQTAAQYWYKIINTPVEWVVGDDTWTLGDGTAELGENGTSVPLTATGAAGTGPPAGGTTQAIALSHGGNRDAINLIWTITVGTVAITGIKIANAATGENFYINTTLAAGEVAVVDSGAMNVTIDGVDAYNVFTPSNRARWMRLAPGANTITVTVNGNTAQNGTIAVEFYDHYA